MGFNLNLMDFILLRAQGRTARFLFVIATL